MESVVVLTTTNPAEAQIALGQLENEGIRGWLRQESVGSTIGITVGKLGEIDVMVSEADYERATHILALDEFGDDPDAPLLSDDTHV